jgi:hypothetical protein
VPRAESGSKQQGLSNKNKKMKPVDIAIAVLEAIIIMLPAKRAQALPQAAGA